MEVDLEARGRRASELSVPPLGLVVVSFFLPAVEACGRVRSPLEEVATRAWWGLPPFVLAAVLFVATAIVAVRARRPPRRQRLWLGPYRQPPAVLEPRVVPGRLLAFVAAGLGTAGVLLTAVWIVHSSPERANFALSCAFLYVALYWTGVDRLHGWTRWAYVLAGFAVQAAFPVGLVMIHGALDPHTPGATVYVVAVASVLIFTLVALAPAIPSAILRRPRATGRRR